jgi:hypothetical protein
MAAALTLQTFPHAGAAVAYTTTASGGLTQTGNTAPCGSGIGLLVKNGSGAGISVNMTVPSGVTVDGMPVTSPYVVGPIANGADEIIPLVAARYQDPTTGLATFGFTATPTSVSVAAIAIG